MKGLTGSLDESRPVQHQKLHERLKEDILDYEKMDDVIDRNFDGVIAGSVYAYSSG